MLNIKNNLVFMSDDVLREKIKGLEDLINLRFDGIDKKVQWMTNTITSNTRFRWQVTIIIPSALTILAILKYTNTI
jgi:hypothetical protein